MTKQMTIVIPYLNEPDNEVYNTVKSIYETSDPSLFRIIVIDDNSDEKYCVNLSEFKEVYQIRNKDRMGVDACRQLGGSLCDTENLLILDSHMRFVNGSNWLNKMIRACKQEPDTIFCSTSLGLGYGNMDVAKHCGKYYAADLMFFDKNANPNRPSRECLEPKWRGKENGETYSVPCVLGAVYFMTKKRFDLIHGFDGLKMWGSSETWISLKNFMSGGMNKIHTGIEVGHRYRDNSPFSTSIYFLYYNKIYICKTILPVELGDRIINCLPNDANFERAMKEIERDKNKIEAEKKYFDSFFTKSIYDYCREFNLDI